MLTKNDERVRGGNHETSGKHTGHLLSGALFPDGGAAGAGGNGGGVRRDPHSGFKHPHYFPGFHLPGPYG